MKKVTITAFVGTGATKQLAGSKEMELPETVEEAVKFYGDDLVPLANRSRVIDEQRGIRAGESTSFAAMFKRLPKAEQERLLSLAKKQEGETKADEAATDETADKPATATAPRKVINRKKNG